MNRQWLVSVVLPLGLAFNIATVHAQSTVGIVHGFTANNGTPVAQAQVLLHRAEDADARADVSVTSDAAGAYVFSNLKPGQYSIKASKGDLESSAATVYVAPQQDLKVDLALAASAGEISPAVAKKFEAMMARIDQLETQLKAKDAAEQPAVSALPSPARHGDLLATTTNDPSQIPISATLAQADKAVASASGSATGQDGQPVSAPATPQVDLQTPFAFGDFTWLNGNPRNKDVVIDTPFFTPEIRFDTHYMEDFNQPKDHTIVGATESFRSGEVQIEQASVGGDFHWQNVRGRVLFMTGLFATTTPRNDASFGVGQWDVRGAYKYTSEAYGGYHFNVQHGLNVDAGIFVSYIGLFSYYNYDNWTYQPSYVSSNTPWFFNGVRVQWYPTNKLKIEPWFINGWQSYEKYNGHPGLGGQLLWMPKEWFKLVANQYGYGQDNLGLPKTQRIHTDDSIELRFYNNPESTGISKIAVSVTADGGCQYGGGLSCTGGRNTTQKESFVGWMVYNRYWWDKDKFAVTFGGGEMSNWGRYLTLLPPIDGADAVTGSVYFPEAPGLRAHMWDSTITLHYMPKQYITWWMEVGYRHSDIPYFAGRGGVTPPGFPLGGTNGYPQYYSCNSGASAMTADPTAAATACSGAGGVWFPDLRRSETKLSAGVMVKF